MTGSVRLPLTVRRPLLQDLTLDKAMIARDLLGESDLSTDGDGEPAAKRPCRAPPEPGQPADEPGWRRSVSVGSEHQAELPALRRRPAARGDRDRLLWAPGRLPETEVERFQRRLRPAVVSAVARPAAAPDPPHRQPDHEQVPSLAGRVGAGRGLRSSGEGRMCGPVCVFDLESGIATMLLPCFAGMQVMIDARVV